MSIVVTPQPDHIPPRVRIDVDSDDPSKPFTSLTILRDGKPIREQPYVGGPESVVFDYEAPFGVPVAYSAVGEIATYTPVYVEAWTSLSGWATKFLTPSVAGGYLNGGAVWRGMAFLPKGRLVSQGLSQFLAPPTGQAYIEFGPVRVTAQYGYQRVRYGAASLSVAGLNSPFRITWDERSMTITTVAGTWSQEYAPQAYLGVLEAAAYGGPSPASRLDDFAIEAPSLSPFAASAIVTLGVTEAWLIHPTFPALSVSIDAGQHRFRDGGINVARASKGAVARASKAARHDPAGSDRAVFFTSGPRSAGEWTLALRARQLVDRDAVTAICHGQSSLLLRSPSGWIWDLPDDWYSVGDIDESRPREGLQHPDREIALPLTPAREPAVRLAAQWTYAADLLRNPTFEDSLAEFPTYLDRLVGP